MDENTVLVHSLEELEGRLRVDNDDATGDLSERREPDDGELVTPTGYMNV